MRQTTDLRFIIIIVIIHFLLLLTKSMAHLGITLRKGNEDKITMTLVLVLFQIRVKRMFPAICLTDVGLRWLISYKLGGGTELDDF